MRNSHLTKDIWMCTEHHSITLYPEWVPRAQNSIADRLSKAWENWHKITPRTLHRAELLANGWKQRLGKDAIPVINVPFNQIRNVFHSLKAENKTACVIHPIWNAQSWWLLVGEKCVDREELGVVSEALEGFKAQFARDCPNWLLAGSVVDFT